LHYDLSFRIPPGCTTITVSPFLSIFKISGAEKKALSTFNLQEQEFIAK